MKLSKKDKKLIQELAHNTGSSFLLKLDKKTMLQLINCELYAQEQSVGVLYDQERVSRLKKLRLEIGVMTAS